MISLITILLLSQLDHYEFTTISSPQTAGDSFQITIYAYDARVTITLSVHEPLVNDTCLLE
ncbi:hypothetical protein ES707_10512 [subsurface metagenome]